MRIMFCKGSRSEKDSMRTCAAKREAGENPARSRRCKHVVLFKCVYRSLKMIFSGRRTKQADSDLFHPPPCESEDLHKNHDHANGELAEGSKLF